MEFATVFKRARAFTLVEMLVTIAIVVILAAMLMGGAKSVMQAGRQSQCVSNLRDLSRAMHMYMQDHNGYFPPTLPFYPEFQPRPGGVYQNLGWYGWWFFPHTVTSVDSASPASYAGGIDSYLKLVYCPETKQKNPKNESGNSIVGGEAGERLLGYPYAVNFRLMTLDDPTAPEPIPLAQVTSPSRTVWMTDTSTKFWGAGSEHPGMPTVDSSHPRHVLNVLWVDGHVTATAKKDLTALDYAPRKD